MSAQEIVNKVCDFLPDGYELTLTMENGSGWVDLYGEDGIIDVPETEDLETIDAKIEAALRFAIKHAAEEVMHNWAAIQKNRIDSK